jgi:hypothetical protein
MSSAMQKSPDSANKDLAARLDEIAKLRAEIDRQFGKGVQNEAASGASSAGERQQPLRLIGTKPPIVDGDEGSPE